MDKAQILRNRLILPFIIAATFKYYYKFHYISVI